MRRRSRGWLVAALLFLVVNVLGGVYAAVQGEPIHAGVHAVLALLGAYLLWWLAPRRDRPRAEAARSAARSQVADRLAHLEQSVDLVALEVERIGEGQRYVTRLVAEQVPQRPAAERAAEPIEIRESDAAPDVRRA